jgi:hypothetical protein
VFNRVENYFNYFTEIEEHFQRRRGSILLLSTLDWALIETWKGAGIPLEAALRGIDAAFDRYEQRPSKTRKVNSLAYCAQEVLAAAEEMKEAAVGAAPEDAATARAETNTPRGFDPVEIAAFLRKNSDLLERATLPEKDGISSGTVARDAARALRDLADDVTARPSVRLENVERHLTVLEEKLFAVLMAVTPDEDVVAVRAQSDRELAPYRSRVPGAQVERLQKQYLFKRLLEKFGLPRLSLFYM